ncbi:ABC transporter permease [Halorarum halobium]|uniref:ABC transporter permease n=1 Tax=Halorarum halobium TaxID=3075121 RepID=UPI0028B1B76C|nr:ABC transporter permease [Halobaculum sp. XH14]
MSQQHDRTIFDDIDEYDPDETVSMWRRNLRLWKETIRQQWAVLTDDPLVVTAMGVLASFILIALFAPLLAPHEPTARLYQSDGVLIAKWMEPSLLGGEGGFLLGTTAEGYDIFSQLIYGARPALIVGFIAALMTVGIGTMVGLTAGYYGGYVDDVLMRLVDFVYGLPLLPTVIVLVTVLGPGLDSIIFAFVLLQWRTSARVIRSLVLSLRERSFVKAARVSGASNWRIISRHIAPNVLPMSFLYGSFAIAWAIITEAGVSFLGLGDPETVSWGVMLQSARSYSAMAEGTWWWFVPPGICIALVVISGFLIGRGYEEIVNPELQVEQ